MQKTTKTCPELVPKVRSRRIHPFFVPPCPRASGDPVSFLLSNFPLPPRGAIHCTISKASSVREERCAHLHHPYAVTHHSNVDYFLHFPPPFFPFSPFPEPSISCSPVLLLSFPTVVPPVPAKAGIQQKSPFDHLVI